MVEGGHERVCIGGRGRGRETNASERARGVAALPDGTRFFFSSRGVLLSLLLWPLGGVSQPQLVLSPPRPVSCLPAHSLCTPRTWVERAGGDETKKQTAWRTQSAPARARRLSSRVLSRARTHALTSYSPAHTTGSSTHIQHPALQKKKEKIVDDRP